MPHPDAVAGLAEWDAVLSMGEQQCLGIIRLLHHRPKWAVLDEATSAMAEDVAAEAYKMLDARNVTYVSVARAAAGLRGYHWQVTGLQLLYPYYG